MLTFSTELLHNLIAALNIFNRDNASSIRRTEKMIQHISVTLEKLKNMIKSHPFEDQQEEIKFFREINPEFYAQYIYYVTIYNIQTHATPGLTKNRIRYLQNELRKIDDFFYHNLDFYRYYRTGRNSLDIEYFTRNGSEYSQANFTPDLYHPFIDKEYCTLYSWKVATILANERLKEYISTAIAGEFSQNKADADIEPMQWTESKTGLYEIIYAFHASKVFNNGTATLEAITRYFEKIFFIELKNPTVTFQEILRRKKGLTFFMDWVRNKYLSYVDTIEERNRQRRTKS